METEIWVALITVTASLVASLVALSVGSWQRRQWRAETEKLQIETDALRRKPLERELKAYDELLNDFLGQFQGLLTQNREIYRELLDDRGALEYHPQVLQRFFASLPQKDGRRVTWYMRIKRLRQHNREILALIQQYGGRILTKDFRDACAAFRYHADQWEDVWHATEYTLKPFGEAEDAESCPIPGDNIIGEGESLYAETYPKSLDTGLNCELKKVKERKQAIELAIESINVNRA